MVINIIKQMTMTEVLLTTAFLVLLAGAAYQDIRERRISDRIVFGLFIVGLLRLICVGEPNVLQGVTGMFVVSIPMLLVTLLSFGGFGGGDIKFMAACGLFLGVEEIFYSFFYALVLGSIYGVLIIFCKNKSKKEEIAFGPFLVLGMLIRLVFRIF